MRRNFFVALVVCIMVGFYAQPSFPQTEKPAPQLLAVWDVIVYPSKFMDYEANMKEFIALLDKHGCPFAWEAYRTEDFHYYFIMPIESLAGIEKFIAYNAEIAQKEEAAFSALGKSLIGTYESETLGAFYLRYDLSYIPEEPRLTEDEMNYIWWSFYYPKAGMEEEAQKISHEWQALYKKNGVRDGWNFFVGYLWSDLPVLVVAGGAKSHADYAVQGEKAMQKFGEEYMSLAKRTMDLTRKFETKFGTIVRELCYSPKKK